MRSLLNLALALSADRRAPSRGGARRGSGEPALNMGATRHVAARADALGEKAQKLE